MAPAPVRPPRPRPLAEFTRFSHRRIAALVALLTLAVAAVPATAGATEASRSESATAAATTSAAGLVTETVAVPVTCVRNTDGSDVSHWVQNLTFTSTHPATVPFGGTFVISTMVAAFDFGGPTDSDDLAVELSYEISDRDGHGPVWDPADVSLPQPVTSVEVARSEPLSYRVRGDVGGQMHVELPYFAVSLVRDTDIGPLRDYARCQPAPGAPSLASVTIGPPLGGVAPGDEVGVVVVRADGSVAYRGGGLLQSGGMTFDLYPLGLAAVRGEGTFRGPTGGGAWLHLQSAPRVGEFGRVEYRSPQTELTLIDPIAGVAVVVPELPTAPLNGRYMVPDGMADRTMAVFGSAGGYDARTGQPVTVLWAVRNLLLP